MMLFEPSGMQGYCQKRLSAQYLRGFIAEWKNDHVKSNDRLRTIQTAATARPTACPVTLAANALI